MHHPLGVQFHAGENLAAQQQPPGVLRDRLRHAPAGDRFKAVACGAFARGRLLLKGPPTPKVPPIEPASCRVSRIGCRVAQGKAAGL
jgi:hypothetical protein